MLVAIALTLILGIADYISEGIFIRKSRIRKMLISLAAGVSITYIFLHLFPIVYSGAQSLSRLIFIFMLMGFVAYNVIEKYIYRHAAHNKIKRDIQEEKAATFFAYHFIMGVVLASILKDNLISGFFYFIPVALHIMVNALPHRQSFQKPIIKAFFSGAPLLGVLVGLFFPMPPVVLFALLGIITGLLLFMESTELEHDKGSPLMFFVGIIIYGLFIVWSWYVGA